MSKDHRSPAWEDIQPSLNTLKELHKVKLYDNVPRKPVLCSGCGKRKSVGIYGLCTSCVILREKVKAERATELFLKLRKALTE